MNPVARFRSPRRLLVVDDEALVRGMLVELFEQAGCEVEEAGSAAEALALSALVRWDGVVLDVDLPDLDGPALYARLVRLGGDAPLPVLFHTGRPGAVRVATAPWVRVVAKPCGGGRLVALMEQCLLAARVASPASGG